MGMKHMSESTFAIMGATSFSVISRTLFRKAFSSEFNKSSNW